MKYLWYSRGLCSQNGMNLIRSFTAALLILSASTAHSAMVDGIDSVLPAPGATDVAVDSPIVVNYTTTVGYAYTDHRKLRIFDVTSGVEVFQANPEAGDAQSGLSEFTITLPNGILLPGKTYSVEVDQGFAVLNTAPWKSGQISSGVWSFSTAALQPGSLDPAVANLLSVYPAPGEQNVPLDTEVSIETPMPAYYGYTTGSYLSVINATTGQVVYSVDPEQGDPQEGQSIFTTQIPVGTLRANTTYEVRLDFGFASVNVSPWRTGTASWTFTTVNSNSGALFNTVDGVTAVSPSPGESGLDPDGVALTLYLSGDAYYGNTTGSALSIFEMGAIEPIFSVDPEDSDTSAGASSYSVLVPPGLLQENTTYSVVVDYQFANLVAAPWRTGEVTPGQWNFSTGQRSPGAVTPAIDGLVSVYPAPGSTEVAANTNVELYFSSRSYFGYTDTSELRIVDSRDDSVFAVANPDFGDVQEGEFHYVMALPTPLETGVTYRVEVDYGFTRFEAAPWVLAGALDWSFTVAGDLQVPDPVDDQPDSGGEDPAPGGGTGGGDSDGDSNDAPEDPTDPGDGDPTNGDQGDDPPNPDPVDPPANDVVATNGTVMFVTQTPLSGVTFGTVISNFSNHVPTSRRAPRGGDLWIRYPDGTLRNLTEEAGFGNSGEQGGSAIAVRSPSVHWSGTKALFSMVVGSPALFETTSYYWQIYEVTGFGQGEAVSITHVANQPADYNNVSPIYAATSMNNNTDEDIIFVSDITHGGRHLYPQYEEYDGAPTNTGLFRMDPTSGELLRLTHAPSGDFTPIIDDFGRMIFTRWDHLQQDQQNGSLIGGLERFGAAINYVDESVGAPVDTVNGAIDIFPEHLVEVNPETGVPYVVDNETGMRFNQFFLWESSPLDGSENEVLNHLGRQELAQSYTRGRFVDDPALNDITTSFLGGHTANTVPIYAPGGVFHAVEDPATPGAFLMTHAQEFAFCGEILYVEAAPSINPEDVAFEKRTEYFDATEIDGCYRNPLGTEDGVLIAAYAPEDFGSNDEAENSFRLRFINEDGTPGGYLTNGISKSVSYWSPDFEISHTGELWELDPVEVRVRPKPATIAHAPTSLAAPEQAACEAAFNNSTVECEQGMSQFRQFLSDNKLALVVSRNVTSRDDSDTQQPFNLRVPGGVESDASQGTEKLYDVTHLQFLQANLVRGYANRPNGRRPLAQYVSDALANGLNASQDGALEIKHDGSVAAIVPAERAVTWHLVDEAQANKSVVSERYWVSFAAGEVRVCANCHGINDKDQMGNPEPTNPPQALTDLLVSWKNWLDSQN